MPRETYPKEVRLCKTAEFKRVFDERHIASDGVLLVFALPNELGHSRLGLSVSRKVGNAPVRNRWKRIIREAFRKNQTKFSGNFDIVVVPQKGVQPPKEHIAEQSLINAVTKIVRRILSR